MLYILGLVCRFALLSKAPWHSTQKYIILVLLRQTFNMVEAKKMLSNYIDMKIEDPKYLNIQIIQIRKGHGMKCSKI